MHEAIKGQWKGDTFHAVTEAVSELSKFIFLASSHLYVTRVLWLQIMGLSIKYMEVRNKIKDLLRDMEIFQVTIDMKFQSVAKISKTWLIAFL